MFFKILILLTFLTFSASKSIIDSEWISFKENYNKIYETQDEENYRQNIFNANLDKIKRHNNEADKGKHTFRLGITEFTDQTSAERKSSGLLIEPLNDVEVKIHSKTNQIIPESVDWRSSGILTNAKSQGECSACWAFSSVAAIESAYAQATGNLIELSEQNLIDCSEGTTGCAAGYISKAYNYAIQKGIDKTECYPYVSRTDKSSKTCTFNSTCAEVKISAYGKVTAHDEEALKAVVARQVVTVSLDGEMEDFHLYNGGIINSQKCRQDAVTHAVVLVGYGIENEIPYWIFKNSWGSNWGENGYGRLYRGNNTCAIVAYSSFYPII